MWQSIDRDTPPPGPAVPDGSRVFAIGDIHGRMDLLDRLLARIIEDVRNAPPQRVAVIFLGDYLDRGPQVRHVIETLVEGPPQGLHGADWICLRGNHEEYALGFLDDDMLGAAWLRNGGIATLRSYVDQMDEQTLLDPPALGFLFKKALPAAHLKFLNRLPLWHVEGDYLFVHAGVRPGVALVDQCPTDLLWIRDGFLKYPGPGAGVVVHGHTPVTLPDVTPYRIGIDTGAYYSGNLTALVLEGTRRRFLVS